MCFCSLFSTSILFFFFFNDTATTEIYTLSYTTLFRSLLLPAIQDALRGAGGRTIEIRAITAAQHLAASPLAADAIYKHHYLALDRSPEALFNSFANSSVRQKVRKALRMGVTVEERTDEEGMRICHAILTDTRRRISLPP